jgi:hypothetical protein
MQPDRSTEHQSALTGSLFVGFFALYMLSVSDRMLDFTDSGAMIDAAARMLDHGIGSAPEAMHEKWCLGQLLLDLFVVAVRRVGQSASPIPQLLLTRLESALPAGLGASVPVLVFAIGRRLGYRRGSATLAALCAGLGTMQWVYAQSLFTESTLALLWLVVIYALLAFTDTGRTRWLALAGSAAGYALITKTASAVVLPILPLWAASILRRRAALERRTIAAASCALLLPLACFSAVSLWYNYARFGHVFEAGYAGERDGLGGGFTTPLLTGLFGLALSPGKGFFFYNPVAILGLLGLRSFLRRHSAAGLAMLGIALSVVLVHARWWAWHGDWAWGPRFMLPLAPIFAVFSLARIERMLHETARWRMLRLALLAALLQLSILVQLLGLSFDPGRFIALVSQRTGIFQGGTYYDEAKFPLLDDGVMLHYVPQFSPLAGHLWMLRAALAQERATRNAILAEPPWRNLNPQWVPKKPKKLDTTLSVWWVLARKRPTPQRELSLALAVALCLLLMAAGITLLRQLATSARRR